MTKEIKRQAAMHMLKDKGVGVPRNEPRIIEQFRKLGFKFGRGKNVLNKPEDRNLI